MTKQDCYNALTHWARQRLAASNGTVPEGFGRDVFVQVLDQIFDLLMKESRVAFPAGYGALFLKTIPARSQKSSSGEMIRLPERMDVRFSSGEKLKQRMKELSQATASIGGLQQSRGDGR